MRKLVLLLLALMVTSCLPAQPTVPTPTPPTPATPVPMSASPTSEQREPSPTAVARSQPTPLPAASDGLGDPYYPQLGNGGYDAQHYTLDLSADMRSGAISGTVTLVARATTDLPAFNLDFQGLTVRAVVVDGQPAASRRASYELTIAPAAPTFAFSW